ncbi:MAG: hypothetical protein NT003_00940 [Candidatus Magasanikbacteria bacterium]|nr:hypothetical protein [Candidatus Magasanikbacteria bacterium]
MLNGKMGDPEKVNEPDFFALLIQYSATKECEIWMIPDQSRAREKIAELYLHLDPEEFQYLTASYQVSQQTFPEHSEIKTEIVSGITARVFGGLMIQIAEDASMEDDDGDDDLHFELDDEPAAN